MSVWMRTEDDVIDSVHKIELACSYLLSNTRVTVEIW